MRCLLGLILFFLIVVSHAQDMPYARHLVDTLTSPTFWGRGYTKNGMTKSADFIEAEFKKAGLQSFNGKFQQTFSYSVNTFPGKMEVSIDGKQLTPGVDFIVGPESRGAKATGSLVKQDSARFVDVKNKIEVVLRDKLTWSVSNESASYTRIEIDKNKVSKSPSSISIAIENKLVPKFKAANVCGFVKGTQKPDSILVITAHYDHLEAWAMLLIFPERMIMPAVWRC